MKQAAECYESYVILNSIRKKCFSTYCKAKLIVDCTNKTKKQMWVGAMKMKMWVFDFFNQKSLFGLILVKREEEREFLDLKMFYFLNLLHF